MTAIIKVLVSQNSSKKTNDYLETEIKVLKEQSDSDFKERIGCLDILDEKFDKVNETLIEVKTQLSMLLSIKTKPT